MHSKHGNSTWYFDATGSVVAKIDPKAKPTMLYDVIVVRNPEIKDPAVPI